MLIGAQLQGKIAVPRAEIVGKAIIAFTLLNDKIYTTPILKHFETDLPPVIVMYASKWAVSAALLQEYDVVY